MNITIRIAKDKTFKIWARKITFPEFPGLEFAVHPYINTDGERTPLYAVSEISSGAFIRYSGSVGKAIENSREYLNGKGMANIKEDIVKYVQKYGPIGATE